jgi:hypothetical protein
MRIPNSAVLATTFLASLSLVLLFAAAAHSAAEPASACADAGLEASALGLCNAYCDAMDFEYQAGSEGEMPEFFRYDLTADDVAECRLALEPPFTCPGS